MPVDLACLGESFEDLIFGGLERVPRLGEELRTKSFKRTYGGGATITAVAAARLGVKTEIISGLSEGACARLRSEGVKITNLKKRNEEHAITAALSTPLDRAFATFDGVNSELGPRFLRALGRVDARVVHCALLPRDLPALTRALHALRKRGTIVSLDFGVDEGLARHPDLEKLMAEADYLLFNEDEAKLYSARSTLTQAEQFFQKHARNTVVKLGALGSRWLSAGEAIEEPAPKVKAVDTTGAGDAFNAGFIAGLLTGLSKRRCLRLANSVGARSTRALGGIDGLPRLEEL